MQNNTSISLVIADDEDFIRQGLTEIVSDKQFNTELVGIAANGIDALNLIQTLHPDIAIIDIKMPGLDGLEVIRQAKEIGCPTRFLILSGYNDFSFAQKAIKYDAKEYFLKPLNIVEFKETFSKQCQQILSERMKKEHISSEALDSLVTSSRSYFLNQLLQNESSPNDVSIEKLNFLDLHISPDSCCVIVFLPEIETEDTIIDFDAIIKKGLPPILKPYLYEAWVYKESQIICIINISSKKNDYVLQTLNACIDHTRTKLGIHLIAGYGNIVSSLQQCSSSYQFALQALSYRIYEPNLSVYDSNIICHQTPSESARNIDFATLTAAVLKNDLNEIKNYIDTFFQSLFFVQMPPPNYIRGMCMYLITNIQKEVGIKRSTTDKVPYFTFEDLDSLTSIRHIKDWLIDFFINFSNEINASSSTHDKIIQVAKQYIKNHLDQNIKAKDIAAEVNLSEAYFAIYFKNYSGINFRNYVLTEKMEQAKIMISSKQHAISEVAYAVGYQDYRSFSRAFKNIVGVSPSEYLNSLDQRF
jgi:two-component system response regulator YesN